MDDIRDAIGADSLAFISVEGLLDALDGPGGYCLGCFTGEYPVPTPGEAYADRQGNQK